MSKYLDATPLGDPLIAGDQSSSPRSLFATLEQPRRFHPIHPGRECRCRTAPAQRLGSIKEWRIGAQRREILEEQREIALFAENVRRKAFDRTVAVQKPGGGPGADARDAGIAVGRVAHEREQVWNELRADAKLFAYPGGIANGFTPAVDLHHPPSPHALRQVLVGRPDGDHLDLVVLGR